MNAVERLRAAREIISDEARWSQSYYAFALGPACGYAHCTVGALALTHMDVPVFKGYFHSGHEFDANVELYKPCGPARSEPAWLYLRKAVVQLHGHEFDGARGPENFNEVADHKGVLAMFDRAIELAEVDQAIEEAEELKEVTA